MAINRRLTRNLSLIILVVIVLINLIAIFHAYKFTHFSEKVGSKTKNPDKLAISEKIKTLVFGINNPKPKNINKPTQKHMSFSLRSNKKIECWYIPNQLATKSRIKTGTVIIFHGYSSHKSSMLDKSDEFLKMGLNVLLVDFMGSGGSEGNQCTLGYDEAQQVKTAFDFIIKTGQKNIYLFGTSMGAVAILKAISDFNLKPRGIMIECPFGSMYKTTCARFRIMKAPVFPMAALLVFWGGAENGFWAFGHNPTKYAKDVFCPTLLFYGEKDKDVSRQEIDEIYQNLPCAKKLVLFPLAEHENYLKKNEKEWNNEILDFIIKI